MYRSLALALAFFVVAPFTGRAADEAKQLKLADGQVILTVPKAWKQVEPKSRIVQYEFVAPADAKQEEKQARVTIMGAGGSIEANVERWQGQFEQPNGDSTKEKTKTEKFEVDGNTIHWIDISGTFRDTMGAGPFSGAKPVLREDYRMLAAIVVTPQQGQYFIKLTAPADVAKELAEDFKKMLKESSSE